MSTEGTYGQRLPKRQEELSTDNNRYREAPRESTTVPQAPQIKALEINSDTTSEPEDPFEPSEPSLLVTKAKISGIRARILIDSGAELNHISQDFCKKHGIVLKEEDYTASMANNTPQELKSTVSPVTISIGGYSQKMRFAANPQNYDLILGKKWTTIHRALINCYTNEICFSHKGKEYKIMAKDPSNQNTVSVNAISKDYKQKYPIFAVMLRKIPAGETARKGTE